MSAITLKVNGQAHALDVDPATPLLYVLSDDLELNGPKFGCGLGQCGACTVIVKGQAIRSCVTPVKAVEGSEITTLEGLGTIEKPHPLQKAFIEEQAAQCGFCVNGVIMTAKALPGQESQGQRAGDPAGHVRRAVPLLHARAHAAGHRSRERRRRRRGEMSRRPNAPADRHPDGRTSRWTRAGSGRRRIFAPAFLEGRRRADRQLQRAGPCGTAAAQEFEGGGRPARRRRINWIPGSPSRADGSVTAYTGKEELGQGISTAQIQLVAEELCVPFERVKLIYCDTAMTPDQGVTSGSQSHPTNFNHAQSGAGGATAREALVQLASKRLGVPVDQLTAADGAISVKGDPSKKVGYGELVGGKKFDLTLDRNAKRKPASEWTVLGKPAQRPDLPALVTGQFEFVHNVRAAGHAARQGGPAAGGGRDGGQRGRKLGAGTCRAS